MLSPFSNSLQPLFQDRYECKVCYEYQISFILTLELTTIRKSLPLDSVALKRRLRATGKWSISVDKISENYYLFYLFTLLTIHKNENKMRGPDRFHGFTA